MISPISDRRYRLCTWQLSRDDDKIQFEHCIHLDGEFGICRIDQPQFDDREEVYKNFSNEHCNNDYTIEEWQQILEDFQYRLGVYRPCDQNISGKEVVALINEGIIK